jgi:hypothetical protein
VLLTGTFDIFQGKRLHLRLEEKYFIVAIRLESNSSIQIIECENLIQGLIVLLHTMFPRIKPEMIVYLMS